MSQIYKFSLDGQQNVIFLPKLVAKVTLYFPFRYLPEAIVKYQRCGQTQTDKGIYFHRIWSTSQVGMDVPPAVPCAAAMLPRQAAVSGARPSALALAAGRLAGYGRAGP
jgi:hypothetical protein